MTNVADGVFLLFHDDAIFYVLPLVGQYHADDDEQAAE